MTDKRMQEHDGHDDGHGDRSDHSDHSGRNHGDHGDHSDHSDHSDHGHDHHANHHHDDDPSLLAHGALRLEDAQALDGVADAVRPWSQWLTDEPFRRGVLQGAWLGHRLHPVLSDLPIGFLASATVLDVLRGKRSAESADTLIALGVLSAVPTALAGWADWGAAPRRTQRVGVVHAVVNGGAVSLYAVSLLQRSRGRRASGVALGLVAATALGVGAFLGGHMAKPGE